MRSVDAPGGTRAGSSRSSSDNTRRLLSREGFASVLERTGLGAAAGRGFGTGLDFGRAALATAFRGRGCAFGRDFAFRTFGAALRSLVFAFGAFAALRALDAGRDLRAFGLGRALGRALAGARLTLAARRLLLFCFCLVPFFALAAINATRNGPLVDLGC